MAFEEFGTYEKVYAVQLEQEMKDAGIPIYGMRIDGPVTWTVMWRNPNQKERDLYIRVLKSHIPNPDGFKKKRSLEERVSDLEKKVNG